MFIIWADNLFFLLIVVFLSGTRRRNRGPQQIAGGKKYKKTTIQPDLYYIHHRYYYYYYHLGEYIDISFILFLMMINCGKVNISYFFCTWSLEISIRRNLVETLFMLDLSVGSFGWFVRPHKHFFLSLSLYFYFISSLCFLIRVSDYLFSEEDSFCCSVLRSYCFLNREGILPPPKTIRDHLCRI